MVIIATNSSVLVRSIPYAITSRATVRMEMGLETVGRVEIEWGGCASMVMGPNNMAMVDSLWLGRLDKIIWNRFCVQ
jgi:hypothetical protein